MINICIKILRYQNYNANAVGTNGLQEKSSWLYVPAAILRSGIYHQKIINMIKINLTYRFIKYCIVGTITTLEGWTIVYCLTEFAGFHYIVSSVVGTPIVLVSAFILNSLWTWGKNDNREIEWLKRFFKNQKTGQ
jgi:hypothetical protein